MALRVWLPLNGTLENKGINDITFTNQSTSGFSDSGKIGKCLNTLNSYYYFTVPQLVNATTFSCCFWYKQNGSSSLTTNWRRILDFTTQRSGESNGLLRFESSYSIANYAISVHSNVNYQVCPSTVGNRSLAQQPDTWYHIAMTLDGSTITFYVNGEVFNSGAQTTGSLTGAVSICETGSQADGWLNDVRIYDHCLSAKEVKEISQGLVLHYKLDSKYFESTTNLITTEDCLSSTCYNGATNKYGYGTNTDMYKEVTTFQGIKGTKVYMGTNGNNAFPYVYVSNMFTSDGTNQPAYKTLSFDYYTNIGTSISVYKLGSGSGTASYKIINSDGLSTGSATDAVEVPIITNEWNHIEITFHGTTSANSEWGYIQNYPSHVSNTQNFWFFANMQLEEKDHATGYVGVGGSRTEGVVKDSSGYENNGIIYGTLKTDTNTAKYENSAYFDGNTASIKVPFNDMIKDRNYTVSVWTYKTVIGTKNYQTILGGPSGFELEARSISNESPLYRLHNWGGGTTAYEFNKWNHFCFVHNDTNCKLYVNGELRITGSSVSVPVGDYFIGSWKVYNSQNYDGWMSDFRIYATALSSEDILDLYHTSANIDNLGNLHGFEFVEDNENKINKNGIIINNIFSSSIINNFTQTRSIQGWTLGGNLDADGHAILVGTAPTISSDTFYVDNDDIYEINFNINMTSPSSSGDGLHLGITSSTNTIRCVYNWSSGTYTETDNASSSWNTYFVGGFKLTRDIHIKTYVVGANVNINTIKPEATDNAVTVSVMKIKSPMSVGFRAGYNTNTTMTLEFWDPSVIKINDYIKASIKSIETVANDFIEK